jgi:hypothetical protein
MQEPENYYLRCMGTENALCEPVIESLRLYWILAAVDDMVGEGLRPTVSLDLEQLQVADYTRFDDVSADQRGFIAGLIASNPIRTEEIAYQSLRSLYGFSWPLPASNADVERAADYEQALNLMLTDTSLALGRVISAPEAKIPYWGRLSFLRVMSRLSADQIETSGLNNVAVTLIKRNAFNATTYAHKSGYVIGLNFALEPILKSFNRYLLHFYFTRDAAGPQRMHRGWTEILPFVMHFWASVPANKLGLKLPLFDHEAARKAHDLTASQVDFILMHELGHVVHDHPKLISRISPVSEELLKTRHKLESQADMFAYTFMQSNRLIVRGVAQSSEDDVTLVPGAPTNPPRLAEYQRDREAMQILFAYMSFIDRAGILLRRRLGGQLKFRPQIDSHPPAGRRRAMVDAMHRAENGKDSELVTYADQFFHDVIQFAEALSDADLQGYMPQVA